MVCSMSPTQSCWLGATRSPNVVAESEDAGWSRLAVTPARPVQVVALGLGHAGRFGQFVVGRLAAEDRGQLGRRRFEPLELFADFEGDADGASVLLDGALQRLADPPGGVGRELESALPVELLDRAQEAERALLDQVDHLDTAVLVAAGPVQDESQVGRDHLLLGLFVAGRHALGELDLFVVVGHGVTVKVSHQETRHVVGIHG